MENPIIISYKLLTDKIAEKYGVAEQIILCEKKDLAHRSEAFKKELSDSALLWLAMVIGNNRENLDEIVEGVNAINHEQQEKFASHYKESAYLTFPFNIVLLN